MKYPFNSLIDFNQIKYISYSSFSSAFSMGSSVDFAITNQDLTSLIVPHYCDQMVESSFAILFAQHKLRML